MRRSGSSLLALAAANARFWPAVAPAVHQSLRSWESHAAALPDPSFRSLALEKLHTERFNAEVAATLATLAPARNRSAAARAIVALEILFDYLDGRTEKLPGDPLLEGSLLFGPFVSAVRDPAESSFAARGGASRLGLPPSTLVMHAGHPSFASVGGCRLPSPARRCFSLRRSSDANPCRSSPWCVPAGGLGEPRRPVRRTGLARVCLRLGVLGLGRPRVDCGGRLPRLHACRGPHDRRRLPRRSPPSSRSSTPSSTPRRTTRAGRPDSSRSSPTRANSKIGFASSRVRPFRGPGKPLIRPTTP